jgi:hypothetical protein
MRALRIVTGIAVWLNALHFVHAIHHFSANNAPLGVGGWAAMCAAIVIDLLCFAGGFLLLWRKG